jgi:lysophospholipase L1-like esterase
MSLTAKFVLSPLLVTQAALARARLPRLPEPSGPRQGVVGRGPLLRLLVMGDSSAAGVGVVTQREALGLPLAQQLAALCGAKVQWQLAAQAGLTTAQTLTMWRDRAQVHDALIADVAVVVTGVNDVVDQVPSHRAVDARQHLANLLRNGHGVQHVVFAPLPPMHQFPALPQPLRWVAGCDARRHNRALFEWTAGRNDVSHVNMQIALGPEVMASDGFHPGMPVYRYCAHAIAQHIAQQVWPQLRS